jgi:hypothetical protein
MHIFTSPLPEPVTEAQLAINSKQFTVADVAKFVEQSGNIAARFRFFETFAANSEFYLLVAKPLLSLGTVGSIDVERRVKPLKNDIFSKGRNRLSDCRGLAYWRGRENLKHIMDAKKQLGKSVTESLF